MAIFNSKLFVYQRVKHVKTTKHVPIETPMEWAHPGLSEVARQDAMIARGLSVPGNPGAQGIQKGTLGIERIMWIRLRQCHNPPPNLP
jgi:hypothetical protein